MSHVATGVLGALLMVIPVPAYWALFIVAKRRHVPNLAQAVIVNLLLGWS